MEKDGDYADVLEMNNFFFCINIYRVLQLFLTLHGQNVHRQQRQLSKFIIH
jgi:hypothetical protein